MLIYGFQDGIPSLRPYDPRFTIRIIECFTPGDNVSKYRSWVKNSISPDNSGCRFAILRMNTRALYLTDGPLLIDSQTFMQILNKRPSGLPEIFTKSQVDAYITHHAIQNLMFFLLLHLTISKSMSSLKQINEEKCQKINFTSVSQVIFRSACRITETFENLAGLPIL